EADAALAGEPLHVDDACERDGVPPVLRVERERAVVALSGGRLVKVVRRVQGDEHRQDLLAVEGDLDPDPLGLAHSSTNSARTPPVAAGGTNATWRRKSPWRGWWSINSAPSASNRASSPPRSATAKATWCMPGPRRATKRPTSVSASSGSSNSTRE